MNDRQDIDARIDASLAAQVRAPRLDRQFDAAVWRRIESAANQPAKVVAEPVRGESSAILWLRACNAAAVLVAVVLLGYYGWQFVGGIAPDLLATPAADAGLPWMSPAAWVVTVCALAFGLRYTALGKWLGTGFP